MVHSREVVTLEYGSRFVVRLEPMGCPLSAESYFPQKRMVDSVRQSADRHRQK